LELPAPRLPSSTPLPPSSVLRLQSSVICLPSHRPPSSVFSPPSSVFPLPSPIFSLHPSPFRFRFQLFSISAFQSVSPLPPTTSAMLLMIGTEASRIPTDPQDEGSCLQTRWSARSTWCPSLRTNPGRRPPASLPSGRAGRDSLSAPATLRCSPAKTAETPAASRSCPSSHPQSRGPAGSLVSCPLACHRKGSAE